MKVSLIAAVAENGVIGRAGALPWRIAADMRFFRRTTVGHYVVTGRKNYEAMGRPLPNRSNLVVSRSADYEALCPVVPSVEAALRVALAAGETEAFVIGGAEIYRLALPYAHTYYRTRVLAKAEGDVYFPALDEAEWRGQVLLEHEADADNDHPFTIEELTRVREPRPL